MNRRCFPFLRALPCALVLASPGLAQKSDAQIQDDIAFAKGLAKDWGFVELATEVIEGIERDGVTSAQQERLGVTRCEIFEVGALNERDRVRRNELFAQALDAFSRFITENPTSSSIPDAQAGFVRLSSTFARSLEISMEDAVGDEVAALREQRIAVLTNAVSKTGELISEVKAIGSADRSEEQKRKLYELMLNRGRMLLDIGRTQEDGTFSFEQANQVLEELVFTVGEGTPPALRAYDLIGQVYAAQEDWMAARDFFQAVVEQAIPSDEAEWKTMIDDLDLGPGDKEKRWLFVELSTEGLCDALTAMGDTAGAGSYALHLYNTQKREGFSFSKQLGYPSLLSAARTLLDSGGWIGGTLAAGDSRWFANEEEAKQAVSSRRKRYPAADVALRIAQQVNSENRGNVLQVRAQKVIAEVIARSGAEVATDVLYEAAEGDYNERNDVLALEGFRRVLRSLEGKDAAARTEFGPKTFWRMGRTYQRLDLQLEVALAFREGCTAWVGDPEYDSPNAQGFYKAMETVMRTSPGDQLIKGLYEQSENLAAQFVEASKDDILYTQGDKARRKKDWEAAIAKFAQVSPSGNSYEKALVWTSVSHFRNGDAEEAERLLTDYVERFVADPINDPGSSQVKLAKRTDALTTAGFYRGYMATLQAQASAKADSVAGVGDPALWQRVIDLVGEYYTRYPDQSSYTPWTMQMVLEANLSLGDIPAARSMYEHMVEDYLDSKRTGLAALMFYKALDARRAKASEAGDDAGATELLREMARLLQLGNKVASTPNFGNLRAESKHWMELEDWETAAVLLERIHSQFEGAADHAVDMAKYVRPDLSHALLELKRVDEALGILDALVTDEANLPAKRTLLDHARAISGWVEGTGNEIVEVPGAGTTPEEFQKAIDTVHAISRSGGVEKWACEWYGYKFQMAYTYLAWATAEGGPQDSRKRASAKGQLQPLVQELGSQFQGGDGVPGVDATCQDADPELARALGGDALRSRMFWLWTKVQ